MESEQLQNFNDRLNQWVADQGFWFQIRHSMSSGGSKGAALFHLLNLGLKLLVFAVIVAAGCWVYLAKRTSTEHFGKMFKDGITSALSATEVKSAPPIRMQGELAIGNLKATGGEQTFFSSLEAKDVRAKMGFLDGVIGQWDLGVVMLSKLEIDLRSGADDAGSSARFGEALFKTSPKVLLNTMEVADATLRWGYLKSLSGSEDLGVVLGQAARPTLKYNHTRGSIENSLMKVQRSEDSMRLSFKGGTFSQNWMHHLEIVSLIVNCNREGVVFEKADLKYGEGTVSFTGLKVKAGPQPEISGIVKIRHLNLAAVLAPSQRGFLEGTISGDFQASGSINDAQGVVLDGRIALDDGDSIRVRDRLQLFRALRAADYSRNYRLVEFREGSFHVKTVAGGIELTEVDLKADDLLTLHGQLTARLPSEDEAIATFIQGGPAGGSPLWAGDRAEDGGEPVAEDDEFSLRQAALVAKREKDTRTEVGGSGKGPSLAERLDVSRQAQQLVEQSGQNLARALRFQGQFRISVPPDAFDRAPRLKAGYPVDPVTGRIPLTVPVEGTLSDMTLKMAEEIYEAARR